jgi:sugar lactone lactonase YvrE
MQIIARSLVPQVVIALLLLSACADTPSSHLTSIEPEAAEQILSPVSATATEISTFDPSAGEFPEGIAINRNGTIFISMTPLGEIWEKTNGAWSVFAAVPLQPGDFGLIGLAFDRQEILYACAVTGDPETNGVWQFDADGNGHRIDGTEAIAFCNAITFDNRGALYASDTILGAVWRIDRDGSVAPWVVSPLLQGDGSFNLGIPIGANDLAYSNRSQRRTIGTMYVAVTEAARVVAIPVMPNGDAGTPSVVAEDGALYGIDGIVEDERGFLYGAVNIQNSIVRIHPASGDVSTVAEDGLDFPASLVFGRTGRDRHALYVTNFALANEIDPAPGVARIDLGPPGRR